MIGGVARPRTKADRSSMPVHSRVHEKDEELDKRDNDLKPRRKRSFSVFASSFLRLRNRRVLIGILVIAALYFIVRNIPNTLVEPIDRRLSRVHQTDAIQHTPPGSEPQGPPPDVEYDDLDAANHFYNGPVRYYRLGTTAQQAKVRPPHEAIKGTVVFAAANFKSLANLLPLACEMGRAGKVDPHVMIFGRNVLSVAEILEINGIRPGECQIMIHDARPDYTLYSTDRRAETAVTGAMTYMGNFITPKAVIVDGGSLEEPFLARALRSKSFSMRYALIELPNASYEALFWITRLDAHSLSSWYKPTIDIVIHASEGKAGSLIRLLKSLRTADYTGLKIPRLTIELPSDVDAISKRWASTLWWPPVFSTDPQRASSLTVRHRIPSSRLSSEEASLRFVESFYPTSTEDHHVLILSPKAELSPMFFQYLHHMILQNRYSAGRVGYNDLLGLSLDIPTSTVNGARPFAAPVVADMLSDTYANDQTMDQQDPAPFLYQAPTTSATLIFGDKWAIFHDFLAKRTQMSHGSNTAKPSKLVAETEPAWNEYLLELMRAMGWVMLHPATSFATMHNELAQIPDEFQPLTTEVKLAAESSAAAGEPFLLAKDPPVLVEHQEAAVPSGNAPLHQVLPFNGKLPELQYLPCLTHEGEKIAGDDFRSRMEQYRTTFRSTIGGCSAETAALKASLSTFTVQDLFCEQLDGH